MKDLTGQVVGQYQIVELIGQGGMANVYRAVQPTINRDVAIKVLPAHLMQDDTFIERFMREVQVIAKLQHPRTVPVYDCGEFNNQPYIVMRYLTGGSLAEMISRSPDGIALDVLVPIVSQVAEALDFAHRHNVIHRDIKPSNILLDEDGNAYLADFGIAKVDEVTAQLTGSGIIGTPAYLAPEMVEQGSTTHLLDVYALGVSIFQAIAGCQPYSATTPVGLMLAHLNEPIPDTRDYRADVTAGVQAVIERAMAKDPAQRYRSAGQLAADFTQAVAETSGGDYAEEYNHRIPTAEHPAVPTASGTIPYQPDQGVDQPPGEAEAWPVTPLPEILVLGGGGLIEIDDPLSDPDSEVVIDDPAQSLIIIGLQGI
ncbi:MAG: serine/threonine protein kinase [Anaerolineae bacterium]|nr:serine/threonine protein kinase [Anaerolineae bacterium]